LLGKLVTRFLEFVEGVLQLELRLIDHARGRLGSKIDFGRRNAFDFPQLRLNLRLATDASRHAFDVERDLRQVSRIDIGHLRGWSTSTTTSNDAH